MKIMIVEDDETSLDRLRTVMSQWFDVVAVWRTGSSIENCPDEVELIVTDVHLTDGSGLDSLKKLYKRRFVPAVVITGDSDQTLVDQALLIHAMGYMVKPVVPETLAATIRLAWQTLTDENRRLIEAAKGLVMGEQQCDELQAIRGLKGAMLDGGLSMVDVAKQVIDGTLKVKPIGVIG